MCRPMIVALFGWPGKPNSSLGYCVWGQTSALRVGPRRRSFVGSDARRTKRAARSLPKKREAISTKLGRRARLCAAPTAARVVAS
jgi:hypothetical protein